ncbi:MAG: isoprenylcysteine carboxylmethyltransferase family protein [Bacteroidales bacterium]
MKTKFLIKSLVTSLFFSAILFLAAGKLNYLQGFIFLITNLLTAFMNFWTIRNDTSLMGERSKAGEGAKQWDKVILGLSGIIYLAAIIIAGLDSGRFLWSAGAHWTIYAAGIILSISGQVIFLSARKENKYFSSVVRIQTDREHQVCDSGVYKIVRHPGYAGMTVSLLAVPLLTGSAWCSIPIGIAVILLLLRTYLEDETLKKELPGYTDFAHNTRQRLLPYVW